MKNMKTALMQKKYFLLFFIVSALSFAILYVLMFLAIYDYSLDLYIEMNGLSYTVATLFLSVIISVMLGVYASTVFYRFNAAQKNDVKTGAAGIASVAAGVLGTGCPMCGSFILGLFGAPLGLLFFPMKGLELKIFSIIVLSASIFLMSKNTASCKTK